MITINGVEFRNLEEQVRKNQEDIKYILEEEGVLNQFGIKVVGQVTSEGELPNASTYKGEYGDAYAVGATTPYDLYIFTRAFSGEPAPFWFNIGAFPAPSTVPGPQGPKGEDGKPSLQYGNIVNYSSPPIVGTSIALLSSAFSRSPEVGEYVSGVLWNIPPDTYITTLKVTQVSGINILCKVVSASSSLKGAPGAQGTPGAQGPQGQQGAQGPQGAQGTKGDAGPGFEVLGIVSAENQLPDPDTVPDNQAYLVGTAAPYDLYVQAIPESGGTAKVWVNAGQVTGVEGPQGPQGPQGIQGPQGEPGPQGPQGTIDQEQINSIKSNILQTIYPVGAYYITENTENPSVTFGFGTWTQVEGRFLVGQSVSDGLILGGQGGEKEHTLTIQEMPEHHHELGSKPNTGNIATSGIYGSDGGGYNPKFDSYFSSTSVGGNQPHNNMPPYRAVFIWRRTV